MKAIDIIERVDLLEPNQYSPEQKLHWLSTLDGRVFEEVMGGRSTDMPRPEIYQTGQEELFIDFPFGEDIYYYYLQAMIAAENSETQRYNKRMTMFNSALAEYENWYMRNHGPVSAEGTHFKF